MSKHNTKPVVVVPIVRVVPVAVRRAHVPCFIVERAAAQNTVLSTGPRSYAIFIADCQMKMNFSKFRPPAAGKARDSEHQSSEFQSTE